MKVRLQATTAILTADEIKSAVPERVLNEIKKNDPKPFLQAYSIVQEGTSRPKIIGEGITPIQWPRKAVETVGKVIKRGLQFFKGHNSDNSTDGRKSLGEVVGTITKEISGRLHQIVVGYFPDKQSASECDVCSIEADAVLRSEGSLTIAEAIENLTGIALGNSRTDTPAFPGAVRVGSLQAFEGDETSGKDDTENPDVKTKTKKVGDTMNFDDVKKYIRDHNVWPNQIYNDEVMRNDNVFGKIFTEKDSFEKQLKELKESNSKVEEDFKNLQKENAKTSAKSKIVTFYPEGITDKQKDFLDKRFNPDKIEDLSDDGLKKFVNKGLEDFKEYASIFGTNDSTDSSVPPGDKKETLDVNLDDVNSVVNDVISD